MRDSSKINRGGAIAAARSHSGGGAAEVIGLGRLKRYKRSGFSLSAGIRLLMTICASLVCLYLWHSWALGLLFVVSALYLMAEVKLGLVWKVYLLLAVIAALAAGCIWTLFQIFPMMGAASRGMNVQAPFLRMAIMLNMMLAMGMNTSLTGLTNTLSSAYMPGFIKLPMIVLIRFIPTFFSDMRQLREAVRIRFRGKSNLRFWLTHPILWSRILFMPLVVRLIRSGDELAIASELKGLSTKTRFGDRHFSLSRGDFIALGCMLITAATAVTLQRMLINA